MADNEYLDLIDTPGQSRQAQPRPQSGGQNEYLDLIDSNVIALPRAQAGVLKKPEPAGQSVQLAQTTGFPASVVGADLESFQQINKGQKAAAAIEKNQWISGYVARNPEAAEVSNDDYDNLDGLSQSIQRLDVPSFLKNRQQSYSNVAEGFRQGFGEAPIGFSKENRENYPITYRVWQPIVAPIDTVFRGVGGVIGAAGAMVSDTARGLGVDDTWANRLDRDVRQLGLVSLIELGMVRPQAGTPKAGARAPGDYVSFDTFMSTLRGMETRAEMDAFLRKRDGGPMDEPKAMLQIEHAKMDSEALTGAVEAAAATKTKERAPTLIEDFVKGHETGTISVPAEIIADLYNKEGKVPARGDGMFGFVPDLANQLQMGMNTGVEITIPVSSYIAHIDPTVHEKVKEGIRFSNDGLTLAEAKEAKPEAIDPEVKVVEKTPFETEREELGIKPLFQEPLPGMTKTDFEQYNKRVTAIQEKALAKATEVQTREAAKRRGEEWKANEATLLPEVEAQVRAFPDIAADRFLRDGTLPDGSSIAKVKLDEGYVNALLVKNDIPAVMLDKVGIHPDDIAPLFGFQSGAALVRSLNDLNTARRATKKSPTQHLNRLIVDELAAQMEAKHGNLEAAIADEARALALDDLHFDILADEMRMLATEAGGVPPYTKDSLKATAQAFFDRLDSKSAAEFEKFQKTAGRNGLLAERALLKGDAIEAFNAKQRQAFNFLMAKEAQKFGKLVDRIAAKIDRVTKNDSIASMDQEHFNQLKATLAGLGFEVKGDVPVPTTSLGDFVANSDGQLAVAAWLTDGTMLPRDPSKLTVEQMTELRKSIDSMMHVGRAVKTLDSARGKAELQNVVFDVKSELDRFDFVSNPLNPTVGQRAKSLGRWVSAWSLLVERMLDYTDKFDPNGPLTTYLDRPLRDANVKEIQLNEKVTRQLRDLSKHTDDSINDIIPNNVIPSVRNESGFLDINRRNLRQLMGYMGSESGIKKVVNGWRVDEADVWKLINENATKADWQWVAGMHKIFEDLWTEAAAMIERDTGVAADKIAPKTMQSDKYGNFPGGYWPIKYDRIDSNIEGHVAGKRSLFDKHYVYAATPQAYTLPRTEWWGALDLSGQLLASHIRGVIHDIAFREPVRNAAKLINNQEFMSEMTQKWGKEYSSLMPGWLKDITNSHTVDDSYAQGAARFFSLVRQNLTSTLIAFNPGTVIKHGGTALGMSAAAVGPGKFLASTWEFGIRGMVGAAKDLMTGQAERPSETFTDAMKAVIDPSEYGDGVRQFILDSSAVMRNRQRQSMDNIREQMNRNLRSGGTQTFMDFRGAALDFGRVPIAASDAVSAFPTWLAAYKDSMSRTGDHAQSVFEADKQVSRAHGSGFIGDKPRVLRTGEALRWVTPLYNFFNHNFNMALQWAWDAGAKWKGRDEPGANIGSLSNRMFWGFIMAVAMEELAAPALDQHKQGIGTQLLLAGIRHVGAWMPGLRDFTNAIASGYEPSVGFLGTVAKTIADTGKDINKSMQAGKMVSQNWLIHTATALGFATGIGGSQFGRTGSYLKDRATGKERTPKTWGELRQGLRTGHSKPRIH